MSKEICDAEDCTAPAAGKAGMFHYCLHHLLTGMPGGYQPKRNPDGSIPKQGKPPTGGSGVKQR